MVRLIMGANGAGKTKQLIELIHAAVESENGSVVCIEPSADMTYDISYNVRLVNAGALSAACTPAITIFPMYSWTTCARSRATRICRRLRTSWAGWIVSATAMT